MRVRILMIAVLSVATLCSSKRQENIDSKELGHRDPKSLYNVCTIATDGLKGFVIAELNSPNWDMYFVPESGGKTFMLACVEACPDDYLMKKSKLVGDGNLEMTKIYISYEGG